MFRILPYHKPAGRNGSPKASRRTFNFAAQEFITRLPLVVMPVADGLLIALVNNVQAGVRVGLGITLAAAALTLVLTGIGFQPDTKPAGRKHHQRNLAGDGWRPQAWPITARRRSQIRGMSR